MQHNVGGSTRIGCVTLLRRRPSALSLPLVLASIHPLLQWQEELSISAAARLSYAPLTSSLAPPAIATFPPISRPYTPPSLTALRPAGTLAATETRGFFSESSVCLSAGVAVVLGGPSAYYFSHSQPLPPASISCRLYALFDSHRSLRFIPDCNSVTCTASNGNTSLPCSSFSATCSKYNDAHCRNTCDKSGGFTPQIHLRRVPGARGSVRRHRPVLHSSTDTESSLHNGSTRIQTLHSTAAEPAVPTQAIKTGTAPEAGEVWRNCCLVTIHCAFSCAKRKTHHTSGNLSKGRLSSAAQVAVPVLVALTAASEYRPSPEAGERLLWSAATCTGSPRAPRKAAAAVVVQRRTVKKATASVAPVPTALFFSTVAAAAGAAGKLQRVIDSLSAVALVSAGALAVPIPHLAVLIPPAAAALSGSLTTTAARKSCSAHTFTSPGLSVLHKREAHCFFRSQVLPLLLLPAPVRVLRVRLTLTPTTATPSGSEAAASVAEKGEAQAAAEVPRKRPAALQVQAAAAPAKSVLQLLSRHVLLPISLVFCVSTGVVLLLHASCHSLVLAFSKASSKCSSESDKSVRMWTPVSSPAVATAARPVPTANFLTAAVLAEEVLWVLRPQMQQVVCAAFAFPTGETDLHNSCNSLSNSCGNSNKREEESSSSRRQRAGSISSKSDGGGCGSGTDRTDDDSENHCGASFSNRKSHRCNSENCGTGGLVQSPERRDRERDGDSASIYHTSVEQLEERSLLVGDHEKAFREMRGNGEANQQQKHTEQLTYYSSAAAACGHRLLSLWHDAHRLLEKPLQLQQVLDTQQFFEEKITREKEVSVHAGHVLTSCIRPLEEEGCSIDNWSIDSGLTGGITTINSNAGGSNRRSTCRATSAADQRNHVGERLALTCPTAVVAKQYLRQRLHIFAAEVYRGLLLRLHEELLEQFSQGFACLVGGSPTFARQATQLRCMYMTVHRKVCAAAALPVDALNLLQPCRRHTARDASTCGYISTSNSGHQWSRKALCRPRCKSNTGNDNVCLQCATEKFTDAIQRLTDERKYTEGIVLEEAAAAVASLQTWKLVCRVAQIAAARLLPILLQLLANHLQAKVRRLCSGKRASP